jgi:hypothetical protein
MDVAFHENLGGGFFTPLRAQHPEQDQHDCCEKGEESRHFSILSVSVSIPFDTIPIFNKPATFS